MGKEACHKEKKNFWLFRTFGTFVLTFDITKQKRNMPQPNSKKLGKEVLTIFRKFESVNMKICDYKNHQRFFLRCLSKGVTLVSLKLKKNIKTHKSDCIIQRAEKSLLNERLRNINNILNCLDHYRYMYQLKLSAILGPDLTKKCEGFIGDLKEH